MAVATSAELVGAAQPSANTNIIPGPVIDSITFNGQTWEVRQGPAAGWVEVLVSCALVLPLCVAFQRPMAALPLVRKLEIRIAKLNLEQILIARRPSYINGALIYTRGDEQLRACNKCREYRRKFPDGLCTPLAKCVRLRGEPWDDICANCKWYDKKVWCVWDYDDEEQDRLDREHVQRFNQRQQRLMLEYKPSVKDESGSSTPAKKEEADSNAKKEEEESTAKKEEESNAKKEEDEKKKPIVFDLDDSIMDQLPEKVEGSTENPLMIDSDTEDDDVILLSTQGSAGDPLVID
ncbi:hypothetical protein F5Y03DRAFT_347729 [Xylaria venustula]|nr:hypothetical protein F5Y03DRAFT_347729 [Xylaria venustula]